MIVRKLSTKARNREKCLYFRSERPLRLWSKSLPAPIVRSFSRIIRWSDRLLFRRLKQTRQSFGGLVWFSWKIGRLKQTMPFGLVPRLDHGGLARLFQSVNPLAEPGQTPNHDLCRAPFALARARSCIVVGFGLSSTQSEIRQVCPFASYQNQTLIMISNYKYPLRLIGLA